MHWSNVFWPKNYGTFGNWAGRLGTIAMLPSTVHATTEPNPTEGRLSSTLGTMGSLAGGLYGGTAGGLFGYPLGAIAGSSLGHGIGHILGSHPKDSY